MNLRTFKKVVAGFTLIEMMIVVALVIILASATVASSRGIIKNLRFGNYFNQIVFMVQSARSLAITGKDKDAVDYYVQLDVPGNAKATVFKTVSGNPVAVETFTFDATTNLKIISTPSCLNTIVIRFTSGTGKPSLLCDNVAQTSLSVGVQENIQNGKNRTFSIHQVAGIPQVN